MRKGLPWWVVPLVIVGLVVIAWLLLAGLPFGRKDAVVTGDGAPTETIAEGTTTAQFDTSGTVIELPGENVPATTSTTTPPLDTIAPAGSPPPDTPVSSPAPTQPPSQPATTTPPPRSEPAPARPAPAPVRTTPPPARPDPAPVRTPPPPPVQREAPSGNAEISETQAAATLSGSIGGAYEGVSRDCLQIRSHGYKNVGYTFSVWDACVSGGGSRMLGRWRVDSKTREVFRQREDGRYLKP